MWENRQGFRGCDRRMTATQYPTKCSKCEGIIDKVDCILNARTILKDKLCGKCRIKMKYGIWNINTKKYLRDDEDNMLVFEYPQQVINYIDRYCASSPSLRIYKLHSPFATGQMVR